MFYNRMDARSKCRGTHGDRDEEKWKKKASPSAAAEKKT
jgi:hypothetical protein